MLIIETGLGVIGSAFIYKSIKDYRNKREHENNIYKVIVDDTIELYRIHLVDYDSIDLFSDQLTKLVLSQSFQDIISSEISSLKLIHISSGDSYIEFLFRH